MLSSASPEGPNTVEIRPGVSILAVLRHLNYRPWFALAEFVDNAVQSWRLNQDRLTATGDGCLRVSIDIEQGPPGRIVIRDNAAGIARPDYPRAFRPAEVPPDASGLSEFGMGMKSAACWFSPRWYVRTSALGEAVERTVSFDIDQIVRDEITELGFEERKVSADAHYTEVVLANVQNVPTRRTLGKIKEHLTDIYREFIREGWLKITFKGELLTYEEPAVLVAPPASDPDGAPHLWRKEIDFDFGDDLKVRGFAALRQVGDTRRSGFALFRRGRIVQGSGDEGYKPDEVFGGANSFRRQRLFGELHLTGFDVSHTKDGFRWGDDEETFLDLLKEHLNEPPLALLRQADNYRAKPSRKALSQVASSAAASVADGVRGSLSSTVEEAQDAGPAMPTPAELPDRQTRLASETVDVTCRGEDWIVHIELNGDAGQRDWLEFSSRERGKAHTLRIRVSLAHPFMVRFANIDPEKVEALVRMAAAIAIAEALANDAGVTSASAIRRNVNKALEGLARA